ncbi:MAG: N-acetylglucosamine-6-phosphate deacetylase [Candidatus Brocadiia bacterium]|jgi:N-acetylglucosamine-6-phosphate deacetylase|nr:N-acetylglucosamine-6-phosphate deacetylase [Candidatus Brocadiia bacterium]
MAKGDLLVISGGEVITPLETIRSGRVVIEGGKIVAVGPARKVTAPKGARRISARGKKVLPGLIGTHIHGMCGTNAKEGVEAVLNIRRNLVRYGVTGFLPTLGCLGEQELRQSLDDVKAAARDPYDGAQVLGVHLEGPYFHPEYGAFPERHLAVPPARTQERLIRLGKGIVKIVTLSPELKGAIGFIKRLAANRVVAAIGHSDADEKVFAKAVDAGASHVIHLYDAMRPRSQEVEGGTEWPALADLILCEDRLHAELIMDGIHVAPTLVRLAVRAKGVDRLVIVTDSTNTAGMPPGRYEFAPGMPVVSDGVSCRTADTLGLSGSLLTLNKGVINMSRMAELPLCQAVQMATLNPARLIRAHRRKGSLEAGKDADICIADENMRVDVTIIRGKVVYTRS